MKDLPSLEYLRECFELDSSSPSGLRWKGRQLSHFKHPTGFSGFSALSAGKQAGNIGNTGYYVLRLDRQRYLTHRIVYALFHGTTDFSSFIVDHKDRNKLNNDPNNLRLACFSVNCINQQRCIDAANTKFSKKLGWFYSFRYKKQTYKASGFETQQEAHLAMKAKRAQVYDLIIL